MRRGDTQSAHGCGPVIAATHGLRTESAPMMRNVLLVAVLLSSAAQARPDEPAVIVLWPDGAPGSEGRSEPEKVRVTDAGERVVSSVHRPSLTVYPAEVASATGAGIVVMPGGGHRELWTDHEGHRVAAWLAEHGVSAFVLKYRLAREEGSRYTVEDHALADARRALRSVRRRAKEWRVDPERLGVMGFSAGGELAALSAMRAETGRPDAADAVERESARPSFQVLVYPGRSANILPSPQAPPVFLLCGADDRPDIAEGLAHVYLRFKQAGVPAELHVYSGVGHGFGLRASHKGPVAHWLDRVREWMDGRGLLKSARQEDYAGSSTTRPSNR